MNVEWVKISDVLFFQEGPGVRNTQYTEKGVKLLNVANLVDGKVDLSTSDRYISEEEAYGKYKHFLCDTGDFIVASSGIKVEYIDKKMGFINETMLPLCMNTSTIRFKVLDNKKLNIRYFMYYLKSHHFKDQLAIHITGSAQLNYGPSHLKKMAMPLIELAKQNVIIEKLDKLQSIITHRKQQLEKLEELVKARFVEMFVSKDYPLVCLDNLSIGKGEYGAQSAACEYDVNRPRYVRITDINDDGTLNNDVVSSSNTADDEHYRLSYGDFLFARMGATVGKTYAYKSGNQIYAGYLIRYKLNTKKIMPEYLYAYTRLNEYWNWVKLNQSGAAQPGINAKKYGSLQVPIAPIEEQIAFESFVKQIDKSKSIEKGGFSMTNFDYLKKEPKFHSFSESAVVAETLYHIDAASCVLAVRRTAEFAIKWMFTADSDLTMPYQDKFVSLINDMEFKSIIGNDMFRRLEFIRVAGNNAAHNSRTVNSEQAELALENLFYFLDLVAYFYAEDYEEQTWNPELLKANTDTVKSEVPDVDVEKLKQENAALKAQLTTQRMEKAQTYVEKPLDISEYKTRKIYIDTMLIDAGWTLGNDWINEYELEGMPNKSGVGYADYVLYGNDGKPLAVIEAKRTCKDVAVGRQQAKLYADLLEKKFGRRPIIFLTNGFDTRIWDDAHYPERKVSGIYSKRDLEKEFNKLTMRTHLDNVRIDDKISGRYYQKEAIKAVCRAFDKENRRKALLVMATGSGKTRTVISIVDVLLRHGWVKNVLFLADRNSLVTQAKRAFVNLLPNLSVVNLVEDKANYNARGVFSTYQTMIHLIDTAEDENGQRLYTAGHFDLIICDEAHRSIYRAPLKTL